MQRRCHTPLFEFICPVCKLKTPERLFRSYEEAVRSLTPCRDCGAKTEVDTAVSFSYTSFKPFKTAAFNTRPGQAEIEITDRRQLRELLRANRMVDHGSTVNNYFGSDPKSVPTLAEISKFGKIDDEEKMAKRAKLVKVSKDPVGDITKLDLAADQTNFGRRQSATRPEFVVGRE